MDISKEVRAKIEFTDGRQIKLVLYRDIAPKTVENFVQLCRRDFYAGLCFHRVIPGFMIQGGGFVFTDGQLQQKTSDAITGEFTENKFVNDLCHEAGVISMARTSDKNSASCQFFICVAPCSYLDGKYAAFGRVADEESLKVAMDISRVKTGKWMMYDDVPVETVVIKTITVE